MKKINKTPGPNPLTVYAEANPDGNWDDGFRNHNGGEDYQVVRRLILEDQGGLRAYCETGLKELPPHKQRVEHFHPKSDTSNPGKNWALDWENILGVCVGGDDSDKETHPLPQNLSCDSRKNNDKQCFSKMAKRWFREKWPSFFTTRRILLGKHAETYLVQIGFQG